MKRIVLTALALSLILVTAATAAEFSADTVTVMSGGKDLGKLYFKGPKVSRNEAMGMIVINKHPFVYQIFPDTKKYVVSNIEEIKKKNPMADAEDFEQWIEKHNMRKVGEETIQGFDCDIYEGNVKLAKDVPSVFMKLWYSEDLEYPIRHETTLQPPMGKVSTYLENIKVGKQPDSLFEVPSGFTKEASMQEAMGMGNFQPPMSNDGGQPPSQEEMEKMMKQMQEMMEKTQKQ